MIPGWWCQLTAGAGWCQDDAPSRKFSPHMSQPRQDDARMTTKKKEKTCGVTDWPHYVHINDSVMITIRWCKAMKSDELFEKCENKWNQWNVLKCNRIIWKSTRNTQNLWKFIRSDERQSNSMEINKKHKIKENHWLAIEIIQNHWQTKNHENRCDANIEKYVFLPRLMGWRQDGGVSPLRGQDDTRMMPHPEFSHTAGTADAGWCRVLLACNEKQGNPMKRYCSQYKTMKTGEKRWDQRKSWKSMTIDGNKWKR